MYNPVLTGFTGAYRDRATAGYPLGSGYRWYLPSLMRLTAQDSASPFASGGLHPYAYCADDPVNRIDPTGHFWESVLSEDLERLAVEGPKATVVGSGPPSESIGAAPSSAEHAAAAAGTPLSARERQVASAAFQHWRGLMEISVERIAILNGVLPLMGRRIKTVEEFFSHFESGRVVVEANTRPGVVEAGHSALYFNQGQHALMRDADGSIDSIYQAKFSKGGRRNYINSTTANSAGYSLFRATLEGKMQYMINKRVLFVLDKEYSPHITAAFEAERQAFTELPYSYGRRYNCHRFVLEILGRLHDLAD